MPPSPTPAKAQFWKLGLGGWRMADAPTVRTVEIKVRKMKNTVGIFPRYQPDLIFFYFVYI